MLQSKVVALCNAGLLHRQLKNIDLAIECHNSAVEIAVASRDKSLEMLACGQLGLDLNALTPVSTYCSSEYKEPPYSFCYMTLCVFPL